MNDSIHNEIGKKKKKLAKDLLESKYFQMWTTTTYDD